MRTDSVNSVVLLTPAQNRSNKEIYSGDILDANYTEVPSEDQIDRFESARKKIEQNVRPTTILASAVVLYSAFKSGMKFMPYLRRAGVKAGEIVSKTAAGVANKVTGTVTNVASKIAKKEINNPINIDAVKDKITKNADALRNKSDLGDVKMMQGIKKFTSDLVGEEKAKKVVDFLGKNGVYNKVRAFDAVGATALGLGFADVSSDAIENGLDNAELRAMESAIFA